MLFFALLKKTSTVDEEIFFQALENTVPAHLAPIMMDAIEPYSRHFKTGLSLRTDKHSPNQLYRDVMSKRLCNSNNNLTGDNRSYYENH